MPRGSSLPGPVPGCWITKGTCMVLRTLPQATKTDATFAGVGGSFFDEGSASTTRSAARSRWRPLTHQESVTLMPLRGRRPRMATPRHFGPRSTHGACETVRGHPTQSHTGPIGPAPIRRAANWRSRRALATICIVAGPGRRRCWSDPSRARVSQAPRARVPQSWLLQGADSIPG